MFKRISYKSVVILFLGLFISLSCSRLDLEASGDGINKNVSEDFHVTLQMAESMIERIQSLT